MLIASVLLGWASAAYAADVVDVKEGWSPESPSPMHAGYLTIQNNSATAKKIVGVTVERYRSASIHDVKHENGLVEMIELAELVIAAHSTLVFEPGGKHLMLMGALKPREIGEQLKGLLLFDDGQSAPFQLRVTTW